MRTTLAVLVVVAVVGSARAQAPDPRTRDAGYIGRQIAELEIDDCPREGVELTDDQRKALASEHYTRGETLYVQGDYDGAVLEMVSAYCLIPYYTILKDIGQAYERNLEYEKAIGYLERYITKVPSDVANAETDKQNVDQRVRVLANLKAKIFVETVPSNAAITIGNDAGIASRAVSRQEIRVVGGRYEMHVAHDGYVPHVRTIDVEIGKPYTFFVQLEPQKGTLSVQATPPGARLFVGDREVGIGRYEATVPAGRYQLGVEAPSYVRQLREVEVLSGQTRRELVDLDPVPETGRRQLLVGASIGVGLATATLLGAFDDSTISSTGFLAGTIGGFVAGYYFVPRDIGLGTSNLTVTAAAGGAFAGFTASRVFSERGTVAQPATGAGLLLGAAAGYYVGDRFQVSVGDAAIFASSMFWASVAGTLFEASFDAPRTVGSGLRLTGLGMGAVGGALLGRYFDISRRHAVLLDLGGVIGGISGFALEALIDQGDTQRSDSRVANFTLAGIGVGLVTAGIATRDYDVAALPVRPSFGAATSQGGKTTTTFGVEGTW